VDKYGKKQLHRTKPFISPFLIKIRFKREATFSILLLSAANINTFLKNPARCLLRQRDLYSILFVYRCIHLQPQQ